MNSFHPSNPLRPSAPIASSSRRAKLIIKHPHSPLHFPPDVSVDLSKVRAYAACRNCRIKKIKCLPGESDLANAGPPGSCQQCVQAGIECTYPPTRDRAAYSRQYVQNLEARVQALEMVQGRMMPLLDAFERGEGEPSRVGRPQHQSRPAVGLEEGEGEQSIRGGVQRSPSQDAEDLGQITFDERGNSRWIGSSNTLSLLGSFSHRSPADPSPPSTSTPHDANPYFGPVAGSGVVKALPGIDEVSYPSARAAAEMVDAFFAEVHPCLPIMAEHEFREGFRRLMELRASHQPQESSGFISVVFAVFALGERAIVGSRAWQRERAKLQEKITGSKLETIQPGEAEAGVIWYERAQILHYTTLRDVNIYQVQCLTLMAAFQASVNAMPMSWLLAGQALRVAQDLGLHRSAARMRLSFAEKQIRARCWWAIYGLERLVSISLGRPLGVDDEDIDIGLPAEVDDQALLRFSRNGIDPNPLDKIEEPPESTMSGFVALTKLCRIAGRVAHVLYRPSNGRSVSDQSWAVSQQNTINKLDQLLRDWLAHVVPEKYKESTSIRSVQSVSAVLSNSYFAILITLHRNFLPPNPDFPRPKPPPSSQSLSHCVEAARSVIHIAANQRTLVPPSHHLAVACQHLWSSAVILLLCEVQAREQVVVDAVGSHVESCRKSLQALEPVWPGSRKLKELLNDVELRAKQVVVAAKAPPCRSPNKRKPALHETAPHGKRPMGLPVADPLTNHAGRLNSVDWHYQQASTGSGSHKHPSSKPRYQTSDTRTNIREKDRAAQPWQMAPSNSDLTTSVEQPIDTSFDIGGVDFNGLDMLQGFTGADLASFWNTFHVEAPLSSQIPPTSLSMSRQNTPSSVPGNASGSSPSTWAFQSPSAAVDGSGTDAEFWSQVTGSTFDWGADPSVPFNI